MAAPYDGRYNDGSLSSVQELVVSTFSIMLISALVGAFIGAAIGRYVDPQRKENKTREEQLRKANEALAIYRQQMNEHFTQTASLVKTITEACRNLQDHVAVDALKLTGLDLREPSSNIDASEFSLARLAGADTIEPPRDYAPKNKGSLGMLSEEYGLHDDYDDEPKTART
jgi:uncharacterized membrane-anchored protein YhcB (DUF1043 family)